MATYKIISDTSYTLEERILPAATAARNGNVRRLGDLVEISITQINAPGVEWGNTPSGWIATIWNGKPRVELTTPPPPATTKIKVAQVDIYDDGSMDINGHPYE